MTSGTRRASTPTDATIHTFWSWFQGIAENLRLDLENAALLADLDRMVAELGEMGWELGPGIRTDHALVLSPDGRAEWLPVTQRIVVMAPSMAGWEFHPAKPAKKWNLSFSLERVPGEELEVDARDWRYVLFRRRDGIFDIVLEQNNLVDALDEERHAAAVILLDGLLGEATRLLSIGDIETTVSLVGNRALKAGPVKVLSQHLTSLLSQTGS